MADNNVANLEQEIARLDSRQKQLLEFMDIAFNYDMRTPLTKISGYTSLLKVEAPLTGEQKTWLSVIEQAVTDLTEMISDILFAGQIERMRIAPDQLRFGAVHLKPILEAGLTRIRSGQSSETDLFLVSLHLPDTLPLVLANGGLISHAIHLLVNFILRTYRVGRLTSSASFTDDAVEVHFSFPADGFYPRYKVDSAQFETTSTCFVFYPEDGSLPLYLSWLIFKWHQGMVTVDYQDPTRALTFRLPKYPENR